MLLVEDVDIRRCCQVGSLEFAFGVAVVGLTERDLAEITTAVDCNLLADVNGKLAQAHLGLELSDNEALEVSRVLVAHELDTADAFEGAQQTRDLTTRLVQAGELLGLARDASKAGPERSAWVRAEANLERSAIIGCVDIG